MSAFSEKKWIESGQIPLIFNLRFNERTTSQKALMFAGFIPFGTGGMRGAMGLGPNRINNVTIARVSYAIGLEQLASYGMLAKIVIGYDNRNYSSEFALTAAQVLSALGCKVFLFSELMATPIIAYAIRDFGATGGIMITASHNGAADNGLKVYDKTGCQLLPEAIKRVQGGLEKCQDIFNIPRTDEGICFIDATFILKYVSKIAEYLPKTQTPKTLSIGYSPQHGTGLKPVIELFGQYGYTNLVLVKEQSTPDGNFPNTDCPNPEDSRSFALLKEYGRAYRLDLLATTDPDADRLGVAYYHPSGEYRQLSGNQIGALLIDYYIASKGTPAGQKYIVKTIVTGGLGAIIAQSYGIKVFDVLTGFKYIGDLINQLGEENFIVGYEESFGYLQFPFMRDKDGLQILLLVAEMANSYKNRGTTLGQRLEKLGQKYGYFEEKLIAIELNELSWQDDMALYLAKITQINWPEIIIKEDYNLGIRTFVTQENRVEKLTLPAAGVWKYYLTDTDWFCFRPSGTEPKLKIYLGVHATTKTKAQQKCEQLEKKIYTYLEIKK
ncbi:MAG: phospho-sugar mutase [Culicoidibacterales bacterium]